MMRVLLVAALVAAVAGAKLKRNRKITTNLVEGQEVRAPTGRFEYVGGLQLPRVWNSSFWSSDLLSYLALFGLGEDGEARVQTCSQQTLVGPVDIFPQHSEARCIVNAQYTDESSDNGVSEVNGLKGMYNVLTGTCTFTIEDVTYEAVLPPSSTVQEFYENITSASDWPEARGIPIPVLQYGVVTGFCTQLLNVIDFDFVKLSNASAFGELETRPFHTDRLRAIYMVAQPINPVSSVVTVKQTSQGGFKLGGELLVSTVGIDRQQPNSYDHTAVVNMGKMSSLSVLCSGQVGSLLTSLDELFTGDTEVDLEGLVTFLSAFDNADARKNSKKSRKTGVNNAGEPVNEFQQGCSSFAALAGQYGALQSIQAIVESLTASFYLFAGFAKHKHFRNVGPKKTRFPIGKNWNPLFLVLMVQADSASDIWLMLTATVAFVEETEPVFGSFYFNAYKRTERFDSDLELQYLKVKENQDPLDVYYNEAEDNPILRDEWEGEYSYKADKKHSYKKGNKKVNQKKQKQARRARKRARLSGFNL